MSEPLFYGIVGGLLAELLGLYSLRHQAPEAFPKYLGTKFYWVVTLLMIGVGGALAHTYMASGIELKPIVAVNIGASAPLILAALVKRPPTEVD